MTFSRTGLIAWAVPTFILLSVIHIFDITRELLDMMIYPRSFWHIFISAFLIFALPCSIVVMLSRYLAADKKPIFFNLLSNFGFTFIFLTVWFSLWVALMNFCDSPYFAKRYPILSELSEIIMLILYFGLGFGFLFLPIFDKDDKGDNIWLWGPWWRALFIGAAIMAFIIASNFIMHLLSADDLYIFELLSPPEFVAVIATACAAQLGLSQANAQKNRDWDRNNLWPIFNDRKKHL